MPKIKLQSSDDKVIMVDVEIAKKSITIKNMLENLNTEDGGEWGIPLPNVNAKILQKIIEYWAQYHDDNPPQFFPNYKNQIDYISFYDGTLFELILAADYLEINGLLEVTCKTVASEIKGKSPRQMRATFNIKNEFALNEKEQVSKTHW